MAGSDVRVGKEFLKCLVVTKEVIKEVQQQLVSKSVKDHLFLNNLCFFLVATRPLRYSIQL
jgi:hypothetical protein